MEREIEGRIVVLRRVSGIGCTLVALAGVLAVAQHDDVATTARGSVQVPGSAPHASAAADASTDGEVSSDAVVGPTSSLERSSSPEDAVAAPAPATTGGSVTAEPSVHRPLPAGDGVRGVTDETIRLGLVTTDAKAVGALGAANGMTGDASGLDYDAGNAAAVDAINSSGGIAGRTVEPIFYFYNAANFASPSGRQQENQQACAHWTEDNEVFAFTGTGGTEEIMAECAASTETPWVATGYHLFLSQRRFDQMSDYYYNPPSFLADRRERAIAAFLLEHGFFAEDAKVALLIEDKADHREGVERGMKPVLAAAGIEPLVEIFYPDVIQSPWPNYVLQLQSAGVTHVVFGATTSRIFPATLMMRAAEDQRYRPQWAMGSDMSPAGLGEFDAPEEQLANTRGMGWLPVMDVADATSQSATADRCGVSLERHGLEKGDRYGREMCEFFFFLQAAFDRADELSVAGLATGVSKLGSAYESAVLIGGATQFGAGVHDGVSVVRHFAYDRDVAQFHYTTAPQRVPQ